jgi:hypothetical protein
MDKNKFWLGGRLFNTASPRLGAPTQCKVRPQDGRPNATQARPHVGRPNNARHKFAQVGPKCPNATRARHWSAKGIKRPHASGGWIRTNFGLEVDFLIQPHQGWAPQHNTRHVQVGFRNARPQRKRKARPQYKVRLHVKLGAPTQRKARPQDGRPNAKLIHNENVHTREH